MSEDRWQRCLAERDGHRERARAWVEAGVVVYDPDRIVIAPTVRIEPGAVLWPDVVLLGDTVLEAGSEIRSGCWLSDTHVARGAVVKPHCVCEGARIGPNASVGPMAHLRSGAVLEDETRVGNFVEVKKTVLRRGAKASHLTYLGDAEVGAGANVGAGTITCNYDGFAKHRTEIGARAFVGSNTSLVAPVRVGEGAIIGAGSVITRDVDAEALAVERAPQKVLEGRAPRIRSRNAERAERLRRNPEE